MLLLLQTGSFLQKDGRKTGAFLAKIRALDGRKDGQNSSCVSKKRVNTTRDILTTKVCKSTQFNVKVHLGEVFIQHVIWLFQDGAISLLHSLPCFSSLTLWTCTKSEKDGQNYKNTGVRRAILPKRPSRRANPSLDGRLSNTGYSSRKRISLNFLG